MWHRFAFELRPVGELVCRALAAQTVANEKMNPTMTQVSGSAIDFTRRFIPERLTPLFHTPAYSRLSDEQRLRYNQLHGCYLNEQTIFFESAMARHILNHFASRKLPAGLAGELPCFIAEEAEHSEMFRQLNRRCLAEVYAKRGPLNHRAHREINLGGVGNRGGGPECCSRQASQAESA